MSRLASAGIALLSGGERNIRTRISFMTLLTSQVDSKSILRHKREGIASNKVGRFCKRAEIFFKFNISRQQPERLINDTMASTGKRPSAKCAHTSRAGTLIISKNFAVLFKNFSSRIRGWTVKESTLTGGSSEGSISRPPTKFSTAGAHRKTSTHSLAVRQDRCTCVILSHPILIDVSEKLWRLKCLGKGIDFIMKF